jgi:hypothetical protein
MALVSNGRPEAIRLALQNPEQSPVNYLLIAQNWLGFAPKCTYLATFVDAVQRYTILRNTRTAPKTLIPSVLGN